MNPALPKGRGLGERKGGVKTKFESNVASELPKTRVSQEPGLPWKVDPSEIASLKSREDELKSTVTGAAPLSARAPFIAAILVAVFFTTLYFVSAAVTQSRQAINAASQKEAAVFGLRSDLEKIAGEKKALSATAIQLEKQVRDLSAQKELYATVIESLSRKSDETSTQ